MFQIDPLSVISMIIIHIGSKHLVFELTEKQKTMIKHPLIQLLILFCLVYLSTKNIFVSLFIVILINIVLNIILNENSEYSILIPEIDNLYENYYIFIQNLQK